MRVYFNEYNIMMNKVIYFPIVSGLLQSYAMTFPLIKNNYEFMPFLFKKDSIDNIISQYHDPKVAAFSVSMWNFNLSLSVACEVKRRFPDCLIIFGGPQVPLDAVEFFKTYSFIDVTVRGEGEQTFAELLLRFIDTWDFKDILGIFYRDIASGACIKNADRIRIKDLDIIPSPYLSGVYDSLFLTDITFQAIIETNRGCPFTCSYCFWGYGNKGYRFFSTERLNKIADWCGKNKIAYLFCADSNFGMFKRDIDIAKYFVSSKVKYGFPEKFRTCYSKNTDENVYTIGKLLTEHNMEKSITMSLQTCDEVTASNAGRKNISLSKYKNLQKRYNQANIPVYTELILGLAGETYESCLKGFESLLQAGIKNQLFVYLCQVYPNTELADAAYRNKFGINTIRVPLTPVHGFISSDEITEYEEIVVSTNSMSVEAWKNIVKISWIMQLMHGLKLMFYVLIYLVEHYGVGYIEFFEYIALLNITSDTAPIITKEIQGYDNVLDSLFDGGIRSVINLEFADIYWEQEESSYLNISKNKEEFFKEMFKVVEEFLKLKGVKYNEDELKEVIEYQKARIIDYKPIEKTEYTFKYNLPEYFETYFGDNSTPILKKSQVMILAGVKDYKGDKKTFAKEIILYGRKSGKILSDVKWVNKENDNK